MRKAIIQNFKLFGIAGSEISLSQRNQGKQSRNCHAPYGHS